MIDELVMPEVGDKAPLFEGPDQSGSTIRLQDYLGKTVVLYFYPADDTPGCTTQSCNLRDGQAELTSRGIVVLGVSKDSVESHQKFADKYSLPFSLIADKGLAITKRYGAYGEKNMYGIKRMGVKRTTFLIDPQGVIQHVFKRPKTKDHTNEILSKLG